jgi:hypothetical protein
MPRTAPSTTSVSRTRTRQGTTLLWRQTKSFRLPFGRTTRNSVLYCRKHQVRPPPCLCTPCPCAFAPLLWCILHCYLLPLVLPALLVLRLTRSHPPRLWPPVVVAYPPRVQLPRSGLLNSIQVGLPFPVRVCEGAVVARRPCLAVCMRERERVVAHARLCCWGRVVERARLCCCVYLLGL